MQNYFCKFPLWEAAKTLTAVAQGRQKAELVIKNSTLVNVCTGELEKNIDVAVVCGRIAYVGKNADHAIGEKTKVIDGSGRYLSPGLLDGHIHIESSMMTARSFAAAVLPHGTTGIYHDPHEICNVLGIDGIKLMLEDADKLPLKIMLTMPSCVPGVPGFEDSGAALTTSDIREFMQDNRTVGLGEMMNYPAIIEGVEGPHSILEETLKADRVITGHYSIPETDRGLNAYISAGVRCCHESTHKEEALAKMRLGMYAMLREGSGWQDLKEVSKAVTEHKIDSRFAVIVTDDAHPHTLVGDGHVDRLLRHAVKVGIPPITAVQMVTINCAQCFRMDNEIGSVTPGKCADLVLFDDLTDFKVSLTVIDGDIVAENGEISLPLASYSYPEYAKDTMKIKAPLTKESFCLKAPTQGQVKVRAIEVIPANAVNKECIVTLKTKDGNVEADITQDVLKAAVFERHHNTGIHSIGFIKGFGIQGGAMASTVAHDAHNLLVIGANDEDMAVAANTLIECKGGMCVVKNGVVLGVVPLPVAGIMSEKSATEMAVLVEELGKAWEKIGCTLPSPFMTMAITSLACIPELRLTNKGLIDCRTFKLTDLFVE